MRLLACFKLGADCTIGWSQKASSTSFYAHRSPFDGVKSWLFPVRLLQLGKKELNQRHCWKDQTPSPIGVSVTRHGPLRRTRHGAVRRRKYWLFKRRKHRASERRRHGTNRRHGKTGRRRHGTCG